MLLTDSDQFNNIDELASFWADSGQNPGLEDHDYFILGKTSLEFGHPSLAYDILKQGMLQYPQCLVLKYSAALALARSGSVTSADKLVNEILPLLKNQDPLYADALSLAGRLAKDICSKVKEPSLRQQYVHKSMEYYKEAFGLTGKIYPGINAATMSLLCGKTQQATDIASRVYNICQQQIKDGRQFDHWFYATVAEANLLLGRYDAALDCYREAVQLAANRYGDIASMRRQIIHLSVVQDQCGNILDVLRVPVVLAFSGHMIDTGDRADARFPPEIEPLVRESILNNLDLLGMATGYCSAACGADIVFLEEMQKRNYETHIILPFKRTEFIKSSVAIAGTEWVSRFEDVAKQATSLTYATQESYLGDDVLFTYTNSLICGKVILKARELESRAVLLTVADHSTHTASGGTLETCATWNNTGNQSIQIDLALLRKKAARPDKSQAQHLTGKQQMSDSKPDKSTSIIPGRQIRTMLFADCVGFSKLQEENTPSFFVNFLGHIAGILQQVEYPPVFSNTWGDGLFLVFKDVNHAAEFALCLRDMVINTDWKQYSLPDGTNIRIGMHTGPVYSAEDPIIKKMNYYGTHVNLAARIEPVTTPGSVYLSEQSACMLAVSTHQEYTSDYLGLTDLAKKYGSGSLYRLRRINRSE